MIQLLMLGCLEGQVVKLLFTGHGDDRAHQHCHRWCQGSLSGHEHKLLWRGSSCRAFLLPSPQPPVCTHGFQIQTNIQTSCSPAAALPGSVIQASTVQGPNASRSLSGPSLLLSFNTWHITCCCAHIHQKPYRSGHECCPLLPHKQASGHRNAC